MLYFDRTNRFSSRFSTCLPSFLNCGATLSQLVLGISIFDLVGSVAWGLSTLPIPKYDEYGRETPIYGAMGNDATCTAQGFLLQLNFTAVFYNISLSTYYLLGTWAIARSSEIIAPTKEATHSTCENNISYCIWVA